jgi:hypothetical protein
MTQTLESIVRAIADDTVESDRNGWSCIICKSGWDFPQKPSADNPWFHAPHCLVSRARELTARNPVQPPKPVDELLRETVAACIRDGESFSYVAHQLYEEFLRQGGQAVSDDLEAWSKDELITEIRRFRLELRRGAPPTSWSQIVATATK